MENTEKKHTDKIENTLQLNVDIQAQLAKEKHFHQEAQNNYEILCDNK